MFAEQISKPFREIIIELLLKDIENECLQSSETEIKFRLKHGMK